MAEESKTGWKTITGAVIVAVAGAAKAIAAQYPEYAILETISEAVMAAGAALGLFGLRSAVAKSSE